MKKILVIPLSCYVVMLLIATSVFALEASPASEATSPGKTLREERLREQAKELRERVATRVAELAKEMRQAWHGEIKGISGTTITLTTKQGDKTVLTSEETSFIRTAAGRGKKIKLENLVVGEKIIAFGRLDQKKEQLTAKVIIAQVILMNINGKVAAVDVEGGTITVQTLKKGSFIVDIETTTKILVWEKGGSPEGVPSALKKYGFSKIKVGDRIHVNGTTPTKPEEGENRITANRILVLPGSAVGITGEKLATPAASPRTSPIASPATK